MFLRRLKLDNICSFETLDLDFTRQEAPNRQFTLLLAENGVGKSALLRALALALSCGDGLLDLLTAPSDWVRWGATQGRILVEVDTPDGGQFNVELNLDSRETRHDTILKNQEMIEKLSVMRRNTTHGYLTAGYGVSRRLSSLGSGSIDQYHSPVAQRVQTLFNPNAGLFPLDEWAFDQHYRRGDAGLDVVRHAFTGLLQGVEFDHIDRQKRQLIFRTDDGLVPLHSLGEGLQSVLVWWGDLMHRITEQGIASENPLDASGLILIDEIDLHLHPVWQRQLRDFLISRLPNFQVIATTHSPLTAQQAGEGELFALRRPAGGLPAALFPFEGDPRYLRVHQLLASPIFGLQTTASRHVESLRQDYRQLQADPNRGSQEDARLEQVKSDLEQASYAGEETELERQQRKLLEECAEYLKK